MAASGERDPRRNFSRPDVRRAWELQGRLCKLCRRAIPVDLMHGDHIEPWTGGGRTELGNLQALCGSCNLRKGARPQDVVQQFFEAAAISPGRGSPRLWQSEALEIVLPAILNEPVLVEACPGAGKTNFGLTVAYRLLAAKEISRILIVAPSLGIVDGWVRASSASDPLSPTLPLRSPTDWRAFNPIGESWCGAVITYHSLAAMSDVFLAHATDPGHRTLVVFDEVHHASVEKSWGMAAQTAFAQAATAVLSLSGTPFRTDEASISFVPWKDGVAAPHYRYSYRRAIADGACRPVQFVEVRGRTEFRTEDGEDHDVSFDDDLSEAGERHRMRAALTWVEPEGIADKMLKDANAYLIALRSAGDSDAAGLVVCMDCDHADRIANHIEGALMRRRPVVACSRTYDPNDPAPEVAIDQFRRSHDPWLVAVNMVSEGVDIRRLRVVVYLTNRMTLLSFRQIVGRVVRSDPANVDDTGRVYITADERLLEMARTVTDEADLPPRVVIIETDPERTAVVPIVGARADRVPFEVLRTQGAQGGAFDTSGNDARTELVKLARLFIEKHSLEGTDPESLALLAMQKPALHAQLLACKSDES